MFRTRDFCIDGRNHRGNDRNVRLFETIPKQDLIFYSAIPDIFPPLVFLKYPTIAT